MEYTLGSNLNLVYTFHKVSMYESPWDDISEYCCHPILQMPEIKAKMPVR